MFNRKPSTVANNTMKYTRIDPALREARRLEWNRPVQWPLFAGAALLLAAALWPAAALGDGPGDAPIVANPGHRRRAAANNSLPVAARPLLRASRKRIE